MEYKNLYTFMKIKELNSFSKAADNLGYAQSTVTTQVKQLEEELGLKLFERRGNSIHITSAGERLGAYCHELFKITDCFIDGLNEEKEPSGILRIAAIDSVCINVLPEILSRYTKAFPKVNYKIISGTAVELKRMLIAGQADIAVLLDFSKPSNEFELLAEEEIALSFFAAIDSPLTNGIISAEDLKNQMFALTEENCKYRKIAQNYFEKNKIVPNIIMESGSTGVILNFVAKGFGVTFLPELAVKNNQSIKSVQIEGECEKVFLQLLIYKNKWKNAALNEFIKMYV
ncbi:MAG: LysR family transcriptional regulator [Lachnospiraceae bacterium]